MICLLKSFYYAARGLLFQLQTERNFRIHCIAAITVCIIASSFYAFSFSEWGLLALLIALVLAAECFNTALEQLADAVTKEQNEKIGRAKDAAAGAVLCLAGGAVAIGFFLFWDREALGRIFQWLKEPWHFLGALVYILVACILIFCKKTYKKDE